MRRRENELNPTDYFNWNVSDKWKIFREFNFDVGYEVFMYCRPPRICWPGAALPASAQRPQFREETARWQRRQARAITDRWVERKMKRHIFFSTDISKILLVEISDGYVSPWTELCCVSCGRRVLQFQRRCIASTKRSRTSMMCRRGSCRMPWSQRHR